MEVGCLKHPGASTIGSQKTAPMAGKSRQPAMSPQEVRGTVTRHTVETVERGREKGVGGELPGR